MEDEKSDLLILFEFLKRGQILEILEIRNLGEIEGGFLDVTISVRSTINDVPCFQTMNVNITRKAIENMYKMLPKKS